MREIQGNNKTGIRIFCLKIYFNELFNKSNKYPRFCDWVCLPDRPIPPNGSKISYFLCPIKLFSPIPLVRGKISVMESKLYKETVFLRQIHDSVNNKLENSVWQNQTRIGEQEVIKVLFTGSVPKNYGHYGKSFVCCAREYKSCRRWRKGQHPVTVSTRSLLNKSIFVKNLNDANSLLFRSTVKRYWSCLFFYPKHKGFQWSTCFVFINGNNSRKINLDGNKKKEIFY